MVVLSELESTFWGVCLESGKKYSQTSEKNFHVSMAALDPSTNKGNEPVSVILEKGDIQYVLCSLVPGVIYQQTLDLNFSEGEDIVLYTKGKGTVHLTGYLHPDEDLPPEAYDSDEDDDEYDEQDEYEEDEDGDDADDDDDDHLNEVKKRKLKQKQLKMSKKAKIDGFLDNEAEEDEEDEDELDADEDEMDEAEMGEGDEDDDDNDDDDDEDDEDGEVGKKGKKKQNELKKKAEPKLEAKSPASAASGTPGSEEKKKKKKKKKNKNRSEDGSSVREAKENNASAAVNQKPSANQQAGKAKKFTAEGGVIIEEVKEGHGPPAKIGKHVKVYYTGKLQNGKIFDAKTSGDPFKFKLGKKEVIAGWDVGLNGMKVGGKRKLIIPPKMGYGSQAAGRIPPNSTLVFDVELKAVL